MVAIGLVGCGVIGSRLAAEIQHHLRGKARLIGLYDSHRDKARALSKRFSPPLQILSLKKLISRSALIIEAASPQAVIEILPEIIRRRKSLLALSTGGILRSSSLMKKARERGIPIYLPSGALAGIDAIKAGCIGTVKKIILTTRKPPRAFQGTPGVMSRSFNLQKIRRPRVLFEGSALAAIHLFPQSVNVAATLALAAATARQVRVRVIADPTISQNIHEVEAIGTAGRIVARTENVPSKENPKTSQLAVYSAVSALRQIFDPVRIGT